MKRKNFFDKKKRLKKAGKDDKNKRRDISPQNAKVIEGDPEKIDKEQFKPVFLQFGKVAVELSKFAKFSKIMLPAITGDFQIKDSKVKDPDGNLVDIGFVAYWYNQTLIDQFVRNLGIGSELSDLKDGHYKEYNAQLPPVAAVGELNFQLFIKSMPTPKKPSGLIYAMIYIKAAYLDHYDENRKFILAKLLKNYMNTGF